MDIDKAIIEKAKRRIKRALKDQTEQPRVYFYTSGDFLPLTKTLNPPHYPVYGIYKFKHGVDERKFHVMPDKLNRLYVKFFKSV